MNLQKNKAKKVIGRFEYVHSVDSINLIEILANALNPSNRIEHLIKLQKKLDHYSNEN